MKINFTHKGNFNNLERFLAKAVHVKPVINAILHKYGRKGVEALAAATPKGSGATAESWTYEIEETAGGSSIVWKNSNQNEGYTITDFINPAIEGIFQNMADEAWREVTS